MNGRFRLLAGGGGGVLVLALAVATLQGRSSGVPVEVEPVARGAIRSTISVSGIIQPAALVKVSASAMGRIIDIPVSEGGRVEVGDVLARIDPVKALAAVRRGEAELASAESDVQVAKANRDQSGEKVARLEQLAARDLVSTEELQSARNQARIHEAQYVSALARVRQTQASLDAAREDVAQTTITAPIAGTIIEMAVKTGEMVSGSTYGPGTLLMTLADVSAMQMHATVDETDIPMITADQIVDIQVDAVPDLILSGRVLSVGHTPTARDAAQEHAPVTFPVEIAVPQSSPRLRTGMSAQGRIVTDERRNVLCVPLQAVRDTTDGESVYCMRQGVARRQRVTTGLSDAHRVEILNGLHEGDVIIVGDARTLRLLNDGTRVTRRLDHAHSPPAKPYPRRNVRRDGFSWMSSPVETPQPGRGTCV